MTREQLEQKIAAISRDIDILNRKIAEVCEHAKERDRLREKLDALVVRLALAEGPKLKPIFVFHGKTKDLPAALEAERKAQKIHL